MTLQMKYQPWLVSDTTLGKNYHIIANSIQISIKFCFLSLKFGLSLFYRCNFDRCLSELDELVTLPPSRVRSTRYFNRLHDFLSPFLGVLKMSVNSSFPRISRPWNSLPAESFLLTYDLNGYKQLSFMIHLFSSFSCNFMPRSGCSVLHGVKPNLKKWLDIKWNQLWKCLKVN